MIYEEKKNEYGDTIRIVFRLTASAITPFVKAVGRQSWSLTYNAGIHVSLY